MERIILDERFYMEKESTYSWILRYEETLSEINSKTGKNKISTDYWYFPSLKLLLKKYVDEHLKLSPAGTLQDLIDEIVKLEMKIDNIANNLK